MEIDPQLLSAWIDSVSEWSTSITRIVNFLFIGYTMSVAMVGVGFFLVIYKFAKRNEELENRIERIESHMDGWYKAND